ncbi:hypothetical protein EZV62_018585 [Acer yangbiense]|uniref:Uncharacterized protein n=1 Tax=Acer yangbiense TaxID=1000413 RepID=A0A5C7HLQ2_9ROSI|nr:hypothetical protein EZV62_018585 [Acer yangbiense]
MEQICSIKQMEIEVIDGSNGARVSSMKDAPSSSIDGGCSIALHLWMLHLGELFNFDGAKELHRMEIKEVGKFLGKMIGKVREVDLEKARDEASMFLHSMKNFSLNQRKGKEICSPGATVSYSRRSGGENHFGGQVREGDVTVRQVASSVVDLTHFRHEIVIMEAGGSSVDQLAVYGVGPSDGFTFKSTSKNSLKSKAGVWKRATRKKAKGSNSNVLRLFLEIRHKRLGSEVESGFIVSSKKLKDDCLSTVEKLLRNQAVHSPNILRDEDMVSWSIDFLAKFRGAQVMNPILPMSSVYSLDKWRKLDNGVFKINTDAAINGVNQRTSLGVLIRNSFSQEATPAASPVGGGWRPVASLAGERWQPPPFEMEAPPPFLMEQAPRFLLIVLGGCGAAIILLVRRGCDRASIM